MLPNPPPKRSFCGLCAIYHGRPRVRDPASVSLLLAPQPVLRRVVRPVSPVLQPVPEEQPREEQSDSNYHLKMLRQKELRVDSLDRSNFPLLSSDDNHEI